MTKKWKSEKGFNDRNKKTLGGFAKWRSVCSIRSNAERKADGKLIVWLKRGGREIIQCNKITYQGNAWIVLGRNFNKRVHRRWSYSSKNRLSSELPVIPTFAVTVRKPGAGTSAFWDLSRKNLYFPTNNCVLSCHVSLIIIIIIIPTVWRKWGHTTSTNERKTSEGIHQYTRRLRMVLKSELRVKSEITAIGALAVPGLRHSFDIINWRLSSSSS